MTIKLGQEIRCGYTVCDFHGDHTPYIVVEVTKRAFQGHKYNVIIQSACFGNQQFVGLKREAAADTLEDWNFLNHTRAAIRAYRSLVRKVRGGYFEPARVWDTLPEWQTMVVPAASEEFISLDFSRRAMADVADTAAVTTETLRTYAEQYNVYRAWANNMTASAGSVTIATNAEDWWSPLDA